jgi:hypothetical protein
MDPVQIAVFNNPDTNGVIHHIRVMQHFHQIPGDMHDPGQRWVPSDCLRFIVDGQYEVEQERYDPRLIRIDETRTIRINDENWSQVADRIGRNQQQ